MADEEDQQAEDGKEINDNSGKKKKLIMMLVLMLVIVGVSIGGTITVLKMLAPPPPVDPDAVMEEEVEAPAQPAIYYPLKPEYILNIDARGRRRYMRLDIALMLRDDELISVIELHRPSIDNVINLIGGGQIFEEIQTAEGKEFLRLQLTQEIQAVFEKEVGKPGVEQVLFTNFVMQ